MAVSAALPIFLLSLGTIAYTLAGYPLLVRGICVFTRRRYRRESIYPAATLVIAVHNEELIIRKKIENTLELIYPHDKIEVFIASDGSTDHTNEIVDQYRDRGIRLIALRERRGKHYAQSSALAQATGEVIVFSDAATILPSNAIEEIVSNFADPAVGCVSSEDKLVTGSAANAEAAYVPAEMRLRRLESAANSVVGVSGSFFAARKEICDDWHPDLSSDFFIVLHAIARGYRGIVDPQSVAYYGSAPSSKAEFPRKVRTVVHGIDVLFHHLFLLNPFRFGIFALQLFSHKLLRWLLPFALIVLFVSNAALWSQGPVFRVLFIAQTAGYLAGVTGLVSRRFANLPAVQLATFVLVSNAAMLVAWMKVAKGERLVTWEPTRR